MLAAVCWGVFLVSAGAVSVRVPEVVRAAPGEEFQVPVTGAGMSGVTGYYFEFGFSAQVEVLAAENGWLNGGWPQPIMNTRAGRCTVGGFGQPALSGTGALLVLHMRVKPGAPEGHVSAMSFLDAELNDGAIPVSAQNGQIAVMRTLVLYTPAVAQAAPGDDFAIPVALDGTDGVNGVYFRVSYDVNLLRFLDVEPATALAPWTGPFVNADMNSVSVAASGVDPLPAHTPLLYLRFHVESSAPPYTETPIGFLEAELNDGAIAVAAEGGIVDVIDPTAAPVGSVGSMLVLGVLLILLLGCKKRSLKP